MMDARSELEDKAGEPDHTAAKSFHGRDSFSARFSS